jgi:hypothetical protein
VMVLVTVLLPVSITDIECAMRLVT